MVDRSTIQGLVGGLLLASILGGLTWVVSRDEAASNAENLVVIERAIELALERERERAGLEQQGIMTRLDAQEASRQEFRAEVRDAIGDLRSSQRQMLDALVIMAGGQ